MWQARDETEGFRPQSTVGREQLAKVSWLSWQQWNTADSGQRGPARPCSSSFPHMSQARDRLSRWPAAERGNLSDNIECGEEISCLSFWVCAGLPRAVGSGRCARSVGLGQLSLDDECLVLSARSEILAF